MNDSPCLPRTRTVQIRLRWFGMGEVCRFNHRLITHMHTCKTECTPTYLILPTYPPTCLPTCLHACMHACTYTYICITLTTQHPKTLCEEWQAVARIVATVAGQLPATLRIVTYAYRHTYARTYIPTYVHAHTYRIHRQNVHACTRTH